MEPEERQLIAQEIGFWISGQTRDLVEAMDCTCKHQFDKVDDTYVGELKCNRCTKLQELKKKGF